MAGENSKAKRRTRRRRTGAQSAVKRAGLAVRLRNYLLAGVLVTAPITITLWLVWQFIAFIDNQIKPLIPVRWDPQRMVEQYVDLPFDLPGLGVITALVGLTIIGFLAAGYFGRSVMRLGERILARVPVARSVYGSVKQILETVLSQKSNAFRKVALIEYPRKESWAIGFITGETEGEVQRLTEANTVNVFVPATPNPTTGFLLFLPREDVYDLDMSVEAGIKLVISGGIITPPQGEGRGEGGREAPPEIPGGAPLDIAGPSLASQLEPPPPTRRALHVRIMARLRNAFLTGILVTVPFGITAWLAWEVISYVDDRVTPLIPPTWNPESYLPFSIPGLGVLIVLTALILIGMFAAGLVGRFLMRSGERAVARVPVVRSLYATTKQIFETVMAERSNAFRETVLFEYPRPGCWAIGFITGETEGHVQELTKDRVINIFLPTTPNPTSGFLLFVPEQQVQVLEMSVEDGLKMVISGGIVTPPDPGAEPEEGEKEEADSGDWSEAGRRETA